MNLPKASLITQQMYDLYERSNSTRKFCDWLFIDVFRTNMDHFDCVTIFGNEDSDMMSEDDFIVCAWLENKLVGKYGCDLCRTILIFLHNELLKKMEK